MSGLSSGARIRGSRTRSRSDLRGVWFRVWCGSDAGWGREKRQGGGRLFRGYGPRFSLVIFRGTHGVHDSRELEINLTSYVLKEDGGIPDKLMERTSGGSTVKL